MTFNKKDKVEIVENAISWIVVFAMFIYGGGKLLQFDGAIAVNKVVSAELITADNKAATTKPDNQSGNSFVIKSIKEAEVLKSISGY